jgi:hypothetical protein
MRKLPVLLVLLLAALMLLAAAASAHAFVLPAATTTPFLASDDDEAEADDDEGDEGDEESVPVEEVDDEAEGCEGDEDELCDAGDLEPEEEAGECLLEDASTSFAAAPGAGQVRLRIHYRALEPAQVVVDARLRGSKGALHLGTDRARLHRAGVYRYSFELGSKQMAKAVAASDLEVDLDAVGAPAACEMHLASRAPRRAK